MVVADLRRGSRMAVVLIPVCEIVRLCRSCGIHLLHLGKRLAHASEGHRHLIRCTLCLAACRYQTVQFVIGIGMAEGTAKLGLAASLRRVYGIGDAQDVVRGIITVLHGDIVTRYVQNQLTIMIFYTIYIHLYTFIYGYRMKFPIIV